MWFPAVLYGWPGAAIAFVAIHVQRERVNSRFRETTDQSRLNSKGMASMLLDLPLRAKLGLLLCGIVVILVLIRLDDIVPFSLRDPLIICLTFTVPVTIVGLAAESRRRSLQYMWFPAILLWPGAAIALLVILSQPAKAELEGEPTLPHQPS